MTAVCFAVCAVHCAVVFVFWVIAYGLRDATGPPYALGTRFEVVSMWVRIWGFSVWG